MPLAVAGMCWKRNSPPNQRSNPAFHHVLIACGAMAELSTNTSDANLNCRASIRPAMHLRWKERPRTWNSFGYVIVGSTAKVRSVACQSIRGEARRGDESDFARRCANGSGCEQKRSDSSEHSRLRLAWLVRRVGRSSRWSPVRWRRTRNCGRS